MLIPASERAQFLRFQLTTAACVLGYGILHDQWVAVISPEHFTIYHPNLVQSDSAALHALLLSMVATSGPGLVLGAAFWVICRAGVGHPRLPYSIVWPRLLALLLFNEVCLVGLAFLSTWRFRTAGEAGLLLPRWLYPEMREDLIIAQNVQLAAYTAGAVGALLLLFILARRRFFHHKANLPHVPVSDG